MMNIAEPSQTAPPMAAGDRRPFLIVALARQIGAAVLVAVAFNSCGGGNTVTPPSPPAVTTVAVTPDTATLQIGATLQLTAAVRDAGNNILSGRSITWTSDNSTIASVSSSGLVTAVAIGGPVQIAAISESHSSAVSIRVVSSGTGTIDQAGGSVTAPGSGATVTVSSGVVMGAIAVQLRDTPVPPVEFGGLSGTAEHLVLPLRPTGGTFASGGSVEMVLPVQGLPSDATTVYVRATFLGVSGSWWAAATVVSANKVRITIPANSFASIATILQRDTLDATFDVETIGFTGSGSSLKTGLFADAFSHVGPASGDDGCNVFIPLANPDELAECATTKLDFGVRHGTGDNVVVLVHGWEPHVKDWVTYYRAQGVTCNADMFLFTLIGYSCDASHLADVNTRALPGRNFFRNLIQALLGDTNTAIVPAPVAVFDYETFHTITQSGTDLANQLLAANPLGPRHFILVGHSMGGLVAREAARQLEAQGKTQMVIGIITLGSPHNGTRLAETGFRVFATIFRLAAGETAGAADLALRWPRREKTPLYLYGGDISGNLFPHPLEYRAGSVVLGPVEGANDGVVPVSSSVPTGFGALAYQRTPYIGYDHTQMFAMPQLGNDPLYRSVRDDIVQLIQLHGVAQLAFGIQPGNAIVNQPMIPAPMIDLLDASGNAVPSGSLQVSLYLGSTTNGTLLATGTSVNGTVTFPGLTLTTASNSVTLTAAVTTNSQISVTSAAFIVSPAPQVPTILATPPTTAFTVTAGAALPAAKTVSITNGGTGTLAGLARGTITYTAGEPTGWLGTATLNSTTPPATLTLQPNTTNLAAATYHAKVPISATGNVSNSPLNIDVTYTVSTASLLAAPTLTAPLDAATGVSTTLTFTWSAVAGANQYWLMIATSPTAFPTDPTASSCPACMMAGFTSATSHTLPNEFPNGGTAVATLSAGTTYYWKVQGFNNSATPNTQGQYSATSSFTTAPAAAPAIVLDKTLVPFTFTIGGALPGVQVVNVTNGGAGSLTGLSVGPVTYAAGQPTGWLGLPVMGSTAPTNVSFAVLPTGVPAGNYSATVQVSSTAPGVTGSPQTITITLAVSAAPPAQFTQQGPKLVGTGAVGGASQGTAVSLSADGNTAIVGGEYDNSLVGATWVWTRSGGIWAQQGTKLVGSNGTGSFSPISQGVSVSLSADGGTAIIGGISGIEGVGAAWVWTRSGGAWTQQGSKLVGADAVGTLTYQGHSVALSADGNTAIIGGYLDNGGVGAAWVWTRNGGVWTQQGAKLVGSGAVGIAEQGYAVSLSADGNTAIVGGFADNNAAGAAWIWTRSGGVWTQQGTKLTGSGAIGDADQGSSVTISADGNTAIVGGHGDNNFAGAVWVWTRSGGVWTQQGTKLVGSDAVGLANQGNAVSLSADGNTAIIAGYGDNGGAGAVWVWTRSGGVWTQLGSKMVGTGAASAAGQGASVSLSADGTTAIVGGYYDNLSAGAAWVFTSPGGSGGSATAARAPLRSKGGGPP